MKVYRHYKGNIYIVLSESIHTETEEILINYCLLSDFLTENPPDKVWSRPAEMFYSTIELDGCTISRFELLDVKILIDC